VAHADVSILRGRLTWQADVGIDWSTWMIDVASFDWLTWTNYMLTRGILCGKWKGATWPNEGLPRGTPFM
jgi:hypothetical protein